MKLQQIFGLFLLLSTLQLHAGNPEKLGLCNFNGKVLAKSNAEALTGATIEIVELNLNAYADFDGSFTFENLPLGKYTVKISYISFQDIRIEEFALKQTLNDHKFFLCSQ